jgi:hypothetical protein
MRSRVLAVLAACALISACAQPTRVAEKGVGRVETRKDEIASLIDMVRADRTKKELLSGAVMSGNVLVIPDLRSPSLRLLFFDQPERSFIPVFSDQTTFDQEAYGTGFEGKAITISAAQFSSLLQGDELVILNPGHRPAIEFQASELKKALTLSRN